MINISLDKQVYIYSVDTSSFYNKNELKTHEILSKCYILRKKYKDEYKKAEKMKDKESVSRYAKRLRIINRYIKSGKELLYIKLVKNNEIRHLNNDTITPKKLISVFDSVLSRTIGMKVNDINTEIIVVQTYFFNVLKDLIKEGFMWNNEKYVVFTASAGQIRTKKTMFIKESVLKKYEKTLNCGLTIEDINNKGGMNTNKLLAYTALCNSATDEWKGFDIHRCIVVDDLETEVTGEMDYIDRKTFDIKREVKTVTITHTDGCGMMLPSVSKKSFMVRLPFIKGLLTPVPFDEFIKSNSDASPIVKDIYGKSWDIFKDEISIIFTKSQFKMAKFYSDWNDYKDKFIKYGCQAAICNVEEDDIQDAKINYQMLQSLYQMKKSELEEIASDTIKDIKEVSSNKDTMLRVLGATKTNKNKNYLQKSLEFYPAMLNDSYIREIIKNKKKSMVKRARAGKLNIKGKYTFIIPDMYAFCEKLFLSADKPKGLLKNGEVYCSLYKDKEKLDCLRSPHLYLEHSVRKNVVNDDNSKWFITNGLYTSIHDLISRELQFDCDGDKSLVCSDERLISVAERHMKNIRPLFYEMASSKSEIINADSIYNGLQAAYKGNIGIISNNISKIWNSKNPNLEAISWLTAYNNYVIDFAKTLYLPQIPTDKKKIINSYIKNKVPHFFIYAKDKEEKNVEENNNSTVNKLEGIIKNVRLNFKNIAEKFDYTKLLADKDVEIDNDIVELYIKLDTNKKWLMKNDDSIKSNDKLYIYTYIRNEIIKLNSDLKYVVDVLVKYLYEKDSSRKETLWRSFGDVIYENLTNNFKGRKACEICGKMIVVKSNRTKYCKSCWREKELEIKRDTWNKNKHKYR